MRTEGEWALSNAHHQHVGPDAYAEVGIHQPTFENLPTVFCVHDTGRVEHENNVTPERLEQFIEERI